MLMAPPVRMWSTALLMTVLANSLKAETCEYSGRKLCITFTVMLQWSRSILLKLDEALDFMEKRQGMCMIIVRRSAVYSLSFKNSHEIIQSMIIVQLENDNHRYHRHNSTKKCLKLKEPSSIITWLWCYRLSIQHGVYTYMSLDDTHAHWACYCMIHMYVLLYTYVYICTKDRMNLFTTTWMHTVRVFKIDAAIRNAFPKCVCGATPLQTRRLLPKIGRLLPRIGKFFLKNRKASSEERWVRTHISFRNAVQLRLRIFRVRV